MLTYLLMMMMLNAPPPVKIVLIEIYPIHVDVTLGSYSLEKFCIFYHLSNDKVGKRKTDPIACATVYTDRFSAAQRRLNKNEQALVDNQCIEWTATGGGRVIPYGCDTSTSEP